jgi:hypothetical protein
VRNTGLSLALDGTVALNAGLDTLTFTTEHDFNDGDIVTYHSDKGPDTSGLVDGTRYRVVVVNESTIQLQAASHTFVDGDIVTYSSNLAIDGSGLANGATYQVVVVDEFSIKLKDFTVLDGSTTVNIFNNTIHFASAHQFQDGDILTYSSNLGILDTSGLQDGGRYRVKVIDANTIQLSDSRIIDSLAISVAVSVAASSSFAVSVAAAGAVALNTITGGFEASVVRSDVDTGGDVDLLAQDNSAILAMLFSAAVSVAASGSAAVGVAVSSTVATNTIGGSTLATITDSDVGSPGNEVSSVRVEAISGSSIQAFALSAAIAAGGSGSVSVQIAGTGVAAVNTTTNSIEASIVGSEVHGNGDIVVLAEDDSRIVAALGAASIAAGGSGAVSVNVAVAATVAVNEIGGHLLATIDDSQVTGADVSVDALSDTDILAFGLAVGIAAGGSGAVSVNVAASGVVAVNTTTNTIEASIVDSTVNAGNDVGVRAEDGSAILAVLASASIAAGGAGAVSVNVGIAVTAGVNTIGSGLLATIDGSTVDAVGAVRVEALSETSIDAIGIAVAVAAGGAGAVSVNGAGTGAVAVNTTTNVIEASIVDSTVDAGGDVAVQARDQSVIRATLLAASIAAGGAGAVSVNVSVSATYAQNMIGGSMLATIDGSVVDSTGGGVTVEALADNAIVATGLGVGVSAGGAGAVSVNVALSAVAATNIIGNSVEASIKGGSDVSANHPSNGFVTVEARDVSDILAVLASASVAAGGAGAVSVNVAGAFVYANNSLTTRTDFDWNGDGVIDFRDISAGIAILTRMNQLRAGADGIFEDMATPGLDGIVNTDSTPSFDDGSTADDNLSVNEAIDAYILENPGSAHLAALKSLIGSSFDINGDGNIDVRDLLLTINPFDDVVVQNSVVAAIESSNVETAGDVIVSASNYDAATGDSSDIKAFGIAAGIAAGGAGAVSVNVAGAGVIAFNEIDSAIEARIVDSTVGAGGDVTVEAQDRAQILSELLAITLSAGGAGAVSVNVAVSFTYAQNTMGGSLLATIDDSKVGSDDGKISVEAYADNQVTALGQAVGLAFGGAGAASFNVAMAGVGATNTTSNSVEASIKGGSDVDANDATHGAVTVGATDVSGIFATLVSAAVSAGGAGGFSLNVAGAGVFASNSIGSSLLAGIDGSDVDTAGALAVTASTVDAGDRMEIASFGIAVGVAAGGAGGVSINVAGAGVIAFNQIGNTIEASIVDSTANAGDDVTISAEDGARILSELGAVTLAAGGAGAASVNVTVSATYASNSLGGSLLAVIDGSDVSSTGGNVILDAFADNSLEAYGQSVGLSAGGAVGVSINVAVSAVLASNTLSNTVEAAITGVSNVDAGAVSLTATDESDVDSVLTAVSVAVGGAGAVSLNLSLALSLAEVDFGTTTRARISASEVTASTGDVTLTALSQGTVDSTGVAVGVSFGGAGAVSGSGAAAGAIASLRSTNLVESVIEQGSDVDAMLGSVLLNATDKTAFTSNVYGVSVAGSFAGAASFALAVAYAETSTDAERHGARAHQRQRCLCRPGRHADGAGRQHRHSNGKGVAISLSAAFGFSLAGAGAGAIVNNNIGQVVEADILGSAAADGQGVTAEGSVTLTATDSISSTADATAASVALSVGWVAGASRSPPPRPATHWPAKPTLASTAARCAPTRATSPSAPIPRAG